MTEAEELQELTKLMNIMIYDLAVIGVRVESTNVPSPNSDIEYTVEIPSKSEAYSEDQLKTKTRNIISQFLIQCDVDKDKLKIKYITRDEEWTNERAKQMKKLLQNESI